MSAVLFDTNGKKSGSESLPKELFKVEASDDLLSHYVRVYLTNQRQETGKTKTRGEVVASTRKIYRQKGTGNARHGALSANIFVGGGKAHGVSRRRIRRTINKKQKQKALFYALSLKAKENDIIILDGVSKLKGKTKEMAQVFSALDIEPRKTCIIYAPDQANILRKSLKNIQKVQTSQSRLLNAYDVLKADKLIFTKEGLNDFISFRTA